jgi:hypothetical protein
VKLAKLIDDLVAAEKKTRIDPLKERSAFYWEQLLRQFGLTRILKTGGFL